MKRIRGDLSLSLICILRLTNLIESLFIKLLNIYYVPTESALKGSEKLSYIDLHYMEPLSLRDLSEKAELSYQLEMHLKLTDPIS